MDEWREVSRELNGGAKYVWADQTLSKRLDVPLTGCIVDRKLEGMERHTGYCSGSSLSARGVRFHRSLVRFPGEVTGR